MPPVPVATTSVEGGEGYMGARRDDLLLCVNDAVNDVSASESSESRFEVEFVCC